MGRTKILLGFKLIADDIDLEVYPLLIPCLVSRSFEIRLQFRSASAPAPLIPTRGVLSHASIHVYAYMCIWIHTGYLDLSTHLLLALFALAALVASHGCLLHVPLPFRGLGLGFGLSGHRLAALVASFLHVLCRCQIRHSSAHAQHP